MACTVLGVGKNLTKDGSTITSHSNDGEYKGDPRLCFIPAGDHKSGSMRPVYFDLIDGPRYITYDRGECYKPKPWQTKLSTPICYVPEVAHTFSYYEGSYSIMNEKGVGTSESTCSGMFYTLPATMGGKACFGIAALGQMAMERASTAKEAVQIMGDFAFQYGFYGSNSFEGSAESLFVNDADEIWIFHVLPDPTGTSAIWAAQRIPDNHVAVIANMFIIREIDFNDSSNFMYSSNIKTIAQERGWWTGGAFDFTWIYSEGEYDHKYYSGRRMWRAYARFGLSYNDTYSDLRYDLVYPVSAPTASGPFGVSDIFSIHRDYYQGTQYDMSAGLAAGPWGITDRWNNEQPVNGTWERSIAVYRSDYLSVAQGKRTGQGGVFYFGPANAASTVFVPMAATCTGVPSEYMDGNTTNLTHSTAYWGSTSSFNVALMKYSYAMANIILPAQKLLETQGEDLVAQLDAQASLLESGAPCDCEPYKKHMYEVYKRLWELPDKIIQTYANGWLNDGPGAPYPTWWLEAVNYTNMDPPALPEEPYGPCYPNPCPNTSNTSLLHVGAAPSPLANVLATPRTSTALRSATEMDALRAHVFSTPLGSSLVENVEPQAASSKKTSFLGRHADTDAALFLQLETGSASNTHEL
eukprot:CAMPEP_0197679560 /NCGR_PEP_ID=MMETSP1338-20131121/91873_1 /TAXON_ID=43686 ORGANISM="Pelagodinium beii, Strain RCC1491" /NCGR_SAMPLE_ID=MMETSP1338 /ASSEMBLY_ACC=CAM_ASM_000754 /LENGTH=637 /DNA_ID=CAMNT_0043260627 /DNA_START=114 /DNA_END=2027 /DNA_ORIENTATION=-